MDVHGSMSVEAAQPLRTLWKWALTVFFLVCLTVTVNALFARLDLCPIRDINTFVDSDLSQSEQPVEFEPLTVGNATRLRQILGFNHVSNIKIAFDSRTLVLRDREYTALCNNLLVYRLEKSALHQLVLQHGQREAISDYELSASGSYVISQIGTNEADSFYRAWDVQTGARLGDFGFAQFETDTEDQTSILLRAGADASFQLWNLHSGEITNTTEQEARSLMTASEVESQPSSVDISYLPDDADVRFSPQLTYVAAVYNRYDLDDTASVDIYEVQTQALVSHIDTHQGGVLFSSDETVLIQFSATSPNFPYTRRLILFDVATGTLLFEHKYDLGPYIRPIHTPDGKLLVLCFDSEKNIYAVP